MAMKTLRCCIAAAGFLFIGLFTPLLRADQIAATPVDTVRAANGLQRSPLEIPNLVITFPESHPEAGTVTDSRAVVYNSETDAATPDVSTLSNCSYLEQCYRSCSEKNPGGSRCDIWLCACSCAAFECPGIACTDCILEY